MYRQLSRWAEVQYLGKLRYRHRRCRPALLIGGHGDRHGDGVNCAVGWDAQGDRSPKAAAATGVDGYEAGHPPRGPKLVNASIQNACDTVIAWRDHLT
ncbi:hypothetical protein [Streptomyces sp. NPDC055692]|uniref:hypothetical protein n=1 Tax=Streptomyces sp. NPDC055692 TaxID=3155683 RepID=UPI00342F58AF